MSKAVLISIHPRWVERIASGEKTIEVRKTRPKLETPFKCYIYCTRDKHLVFMQNAEGTNLITCMNAEAAIPVGGFVGNGKVIGEFTCDGITRVNISGFWSADGKQLNNQIKETCLTPQEFCNYLGTQTGYGWHISDLKIYAKPRELDEFTGLRGTRFGAEPVEIKRPPQSWRYVADQNRIK